MSPLGNVSVKQKRKLVIHPSRILFDKGCAEFVEVAKVLKPLYPEWQFLMIGAAGYLNKSAVPKHIVDGWNATGVIQWIDHTENIQDFFCDAAITTLFSHREGFPKVLVEACFARSAIVTVDSIGCKDVVRHEQSGLICKFGEIDEYSHAVRRLIDDADLRNKLSDVAYNYALANYSTDRITELHENLYFRKK